MRRKTDSPEITAALPFQAATATTELLKDLKKVTAHVKKPVVADPFKVPEPEQVRKVRAKRGSPVTDYVKSLPGGPFLTTLDVARELKVSPQLIRKYVKDRDIPGPSFTAPFGKISIYLYTPADVEALKEYMQSRKVVIPIDKSEPMGEPEALKRVRKNKGG